MNDVQMMLGKRAAEYYLFITWCITAPLLTLVSTYGTCCSEQFSNKFIAFVEIQPMRKSMTAYISSIGHVAFQYHLHRMSVVLPYITSVCDQLRL